MSNESHSLKISPKIGETYQTMQDQSRNTPGVQEVSWEMNVRLLQDLCSEAEFRHFRFSSDEPAAVGGSDIGPNPLSYILAGFGFCINSFIARFASVEKISLQSVDTKVKGATDRRGIFGVGGVRAGYTKIEYEVKIESNSPPEKISDLLRLTIARCPAVNALNPTPVLVKLLVNGQSTSI